MVAGDPERANAARRRLEGIPVGPILLGKVKGVASRSASAVMRGDAARLQSLGNRWAPLQSEARFQIAPHYKPQPLSSRPP